MSFLKFLKRDKNQEPDLDLGSVDDLDMPPLPPGMGKEELKDMKNGLPELPELPELPKKEKLFSDPLKEQSQELKLLDINEFPKPEQKRSFPRYPGPEIQKPEGDIGIPKYPIPRRPLFGARRDMPIFSGQKFSEQKSESEFPKREPEKRPIERIERGIMREERAILNHKGVNGPRYVKVNKFKNLLGEAGAIKNDLKTADQSILKLNDIYLNKGKVLEKWRDGMVDLQKKLIFIDKTLFKGGKDE